MEKTDKKLIFIPDKIAQLSKEYPDRSAVIAADRILTYKNLDMLSDKAAFGILDRCADLEEETSIGLLLDRKSYVFPLEIGIVRAGFSYIPMTDEYPEERINYCMQDADSPVLITTSKILDEKKSLKDSGFRIYLVEEILSYEGEVKALPQIRGGRLSHIIYTSGSTGVPKGVKHTVLSDSMWVCPADDAAPQYEYFSEKRVTMAVTQISFVASILDYSALYNGGCVVFPAEEDFRDIGALSAKMLEYEVQSLFATPSFVRNMLDIRSARPAIAILDVLFLGGEKADDKFADDLFKINPWIHLINGYGCTETNSGIFAKLITSKDRKMSIGKPLSYINTLILSERAEEQSKEEPSESGQLLVSGPVITAGYQKLEEKNETSFVTIDGRRFFKTGDIVSKDENGDYQVTGRMDDMVKYHGQRVELGEIEAVIAKLDEVKSCKVLMKNSGQEDFLCAFYTASSDIEGKEISDFLKAKLPAYMIPGVFVRLDEMPLNSSRKIDRKALLEMEVTFDGGDYVAPENDLEKKLCYLFGKIFGMEKISALADFFEYGGTSLSVSKLISMLSDEGYAVSYGDVFENPTPKKLAFFIENAENKVMVPPMDREEYPLTKTQLGIYLEGITGGSRQTYTTNYMMKALPEVTDEQLIDAVGKFYDAHPALKYVIRCRDNELPHMVVVPNAKIEVPVFEGESKDRIDFINNYLPVVSVLDELLFHFAVYKTKECCYLILKSQLIAVDGTSISLIISDLNRALGGEELLREDCTIEQVGMYEEALMESGAHEKAREYYRNLFAKMDGIDSLMGDLNKPLTPGVSKNFRYEPGTLKAETVKKFCDRLQITESTFFMGAMAILLGKYLYSEHVSFSTVYNGRSLPEMENTIGSLIKRIPVYGDLSDNVDIVSFLNSISKQIFANMSNDIFSFDEVLKECPVNEDVEFIYQGDLFTDNMGKASGISLLQSDSYFMEQYHTGMVTGCMSIQMFSTDGLYNMTIEYRNEKFSEKWIREFADHLFIIASKLMTCETIGDIVMMSPEESGEIESFNDTAYSIDFVPVQEQIAAYAKETPSKKAVICNGESLTFKELHLLSNRIADYLVKKGVGKDIPVGVLLDRSVYVYVAENGILKAGGAFVPFIPEYPGERIDFCMSDANIPILLTSADIRDKRKELCKKEYEIITLEEIFGADSLSEITAKDEYACYRATASEKADLAYCIYTSGSTGRPKGVMIEHGNIANYVHKNEKSVEIMHYAKAGRVCLAMASFSFDVSVVEQFVPLCNGNTVVIATEDEIHDPELFAKLVTDNGVDGMTCTPTYLGSLLGIAASREAIKNITFFDIGAEAFPSQLFGELRSLREDSVILNVYGPTECTMGCSADVVEDSSKVTIGGPIANTSFYIFDKFGNELPVGIRGELIIAGDQVGRGYVALPEKTAAAFFEYKGKKAYHSGDLCSFTEEGKVRIFGRIDNQIKLRGFRIELDEIEKVMSEFKDISAAAVRVINSGGKEFLAGYYVSEKDADIASYKEFIKEKLPEYMVPQIIRRVEKMPLTVNGKIDRKALPIPDVSELKAKYVAPSNETEKRICEAFAKALGLSKEEIGTADDFFELGGDSLKAMAVLAEAGIETLTAADVFQKRNARDIAIVVDERSSKGDPDEREAAARLKAHGLTPMQVKMIDYQLYNPGSSMWSNMHFLTRYEKNIDAGRLCDAVNKAIKNHPALSVVFEYNDDCVLQQRYDPAITPEVTVESVTEEDILELSKTLVTPFKRILNSCLFRARIFSTDEHTYFFMDVHHLLMDGGSLGVLLKDVTDAYFGRELLRDYYFSLLEDADEAALKGTYENDGEYFRQQYGENADGYMLIPAPDHRSNKNSSAGRIRRLSFDADQVRKAEEYWGVTHSCMAITSALMALSEHEQTDKVMCNWIFNDRLSPLSEHAVGLLIKNLPVGVDMLKFSDTGDLLMEVKRQIGEGIAHSSYDYFATFDSAFNSDPMEVNLQLGINGDELDELSPELVELDDPYFAASARLELELLENEYGDGGYDAELEYVKEIFDEENIYSFHDTYVRILESIVKMEI